MPASDHKLHHPLVVHAPEDRESEVCHDVESDQGERPHEHHMMVQVEEVGATGQIDRESPPALGSSTSPSELACGKVLW